MLENSLDFGTVFLIETKGNEMRIKPVNFRIGKCNGVSLVVRGQYTVPRNAAVSLRDLMNNLTDGTVKEQMCIEI